MPVLGICIFMSYVPGVIGQPVNDDCANATIVAAGTIAFSTVGATTDGPTVCAPYESDIWFQYQPDQSGYVTVSTCSPALTFDTVVSIFINRSQPCDSAPAVCNDTGVPHCPAGGSKVRIAARTDRIYLIHVGGIEGQVGSGELLIRVCPGDFDGDGMVALSDLVIMLSELSTAGCGAAGCRTDLDGDGDVDLVDLVTMLDLFATFCP